MKFGQLIECNMRNLFFFLEISSTKYGRAATIIFIIFWDCLTFYQIFLSPQVKQSVISINKYGIYELPPELPNDLKLGILRN